MLWLDFHVTLSKKVLDLVSGWKLKTKICLKKPYFFILQHQFEKYLNLRLWKGNLLESQTLNVPIEAKPTAGARKSGSEYLQLLVSLYYRDEKDYIEMIWLHYVDIRWGYIIYKWDDWIRNEIRCWDVPVLYCVTM